MQTNNPKRKKREQQKPEYKNLTPFKEMEKHFKLYNKKETDFSILYEPNQYDNIQGYQVAFLPFPKGAILVKNFNQPQIVVEIAAQALNQFCKPPYRTNLNSRQQLYKEENTSNPKEEKEQKKQQQILEENKDKGYFFNDKIRWANVGYQYDWTQRKYPNLKTQIPQIIEEICQRANKLYNLIRKQSKNYCPESAIINYYGEKDYMTGHLDDAEIDQSSPIYSFSFGLSCIFLIGGISKEEKPISLRLNSGDLFIMGQQSRKCYHGVPRVLSQTYNSDNNEIKKQKIGQPNKYQNIENYLKTHRININVRQVYPSEA